MGPKINGHFLYGQKNQSIKDIKTSEYEKQIIEKNKEIRFLKEKLKLKEKIIKQLTSELQNIKWIKKITILRDKIHQLENIAYGVEFDQKPQERLNK